jgi:hypothetical protein
MVAQTSTEHRKRCLQVALILPVGGLRAIATLSSAVIFVNTAYLEYLLENCIVFSNEC